MPEPLSSSAPQAADGPSGCIEVTDLAVGYRDVPFLQQVRLALEPGRRMVLSGSSGCGKTSLLRCLLGLLRPLDGQIRICGQLLTEQTVWKLRSQIGYVPQEPDLGFGSVRQYLQRVFRFQVNQGVSFEEQTLKALMDRWKLSVSLLDQPCADLSGGQKQRFAVLLAILLKRTIFLLDEPTSALDLAAKDTLFGWIENHPDHTMLIVTHDARLKSIAHEVLDLDDFVPRRKP